MIVLNELNKNNSNELKNFNSHLINQLVELWNEITKKFNLQENISTLISNYLFYQLISCHEVSIKLIKILKKLKDLKIKRNILISIYASLIEFCDIIRKFTFQIMTNNITSTSSLSSSSSLPLSPISILSNDNENDNLQIKCFKIFLSFAISILYLKIIFDYCNYFSESNSSQLSLESLPKSIRKGVLKCLSLISYNFSLYGQILLEDSTSIQSIESILESKLSWLFQNIFLSNNLFQDFKTLSFTHDNLMNLFYLTYSPTFPRLVDDIIGDILSTLEEKSESHIIEIKKSTSNNTSSNNLLKRSSFIFNHKNTLALGLEQSIKSSNISLSDLDVHSNSISGNNNNNNHNNNNNINSPFIHLRALSSTKETNSLLSKSRNSSKNGYRLNMESKLQKYLTTSNSSPIIKSKRVQNIYQSNNLISIENKSSTLQNSSKKLHSSTSEDFSSNETNVKKKRKVEGSKNLSSPSFERRLVVEDTPIRSIVKK